MDTSVTQLRVIFPFKDHQKAFKINGLISQTVNFIPHKEQKSFVGLKTHVLNIFNMIDQFGLELLFYAVVSKVNWMAMFNIFCL